MKKSFANAKNYLMSYLNPKIQEKTNRHLILAAIGVATLAGVFSFLPRTTTSPDVPVDSKIPSIDTFIPAGYTLVPIEIQNQESLDSVLGSYGIVDLYTADQQGKPKKIADRIKILRSPKNPQVFAVLVREENAAKVAGQVGPIFVTIASQKSNGRKDKPTLFKKQRFSIQEEG